MSLVCFPGIPQVMFSLSPPSMAELQVYTTSIITLKLCPLLTFLIAKKKYLNSVPVEFRLLAILLLALAPLHLKDHHFCEHSCKLWRVTQRESTELGPVKTV